jgi:Immunity protein 35
MISIEEGKQLALDELHKIEKISNIELALLESKTREFEYGWVFFYQAKEFILTGNMDSLVGGNAPIIVDKYYKTVYITGTGNDISFYIQKYSDERK